MKKNIYVKDGKKVKTIVITINENIIKDIIKEIDNYNGKGEILEKDTDVLNYTDDISLIDKKIEIIDKKYIGNGQRYYDCCAEVDKVKMYRYKYYAFKEHILSKLCTKLLNTENTLNLSYIIKDILTYKWENKFEIEIIDKILKSLKIKKIKNYSDTKIEIIKINELTLLKKIKNILTNKENNNIKTINSSKEFNKDVENKISSMEAFNEGFHAQELKDKEFSYNASEKSEIKRKILTKIPTIEETKTL